MRRVKILDETAEEAIEAAAWYEQEHPGLGVEFDHAMNAAFDLLEDAKTKSLFGKIIRCSRCPRGQRTRAQTFFL